MSKIGQPDEKAAIIAVMAQSLTLDRPTLSYAQKSGQVHMD
jgi:hypothetical protein